MGLKSRVKIEHNGSQGGRCASREVVKQSSKHHRRVEAKRAEREAKNSGGDAKI